MTAPPPQPRKGLSEGPCHVPKRHRVRILLLFVLGSCLVYPTTIKLGRRWKPSRRDDLTDIGQPGTVINAEVGVDPPVSTSIAEVNSKVSATYHSQASSKNIPSATAESTTPSTAPRTTSAAFAQFGPQPTTASNTESTVRGGENDKLPTVRPTTPLTGETAVEARTIETTTGTRRISTPAKRFDLEAAKSNKSIAKNTIDEAPNNTAKVQLTTIGRNSTNLLEPPRMPGMHASCAAEDILGAFESYAKWHASVSALAENGTIPAGVRYMRWSCPEMPRDCAGMGDRYIGILDFFFTAISLGRFLIISSSAHFPVSHAFSEQRIRWNLRPHPVSEAREEFVHWWDACNSTCRSEGITALEGKEGIRIAYRNPPLVLPAHESRWGCSAESVHALLRVPTLRRAASRLLLVVNSNIEREVSEFISGAGVPQSFMALHIRTGRGTLESHIDRFRDLTNPISVSRAALECLRKLRGCPEDDRKDARHAPVVLTSDDPRIKSALPVLAKKEFNMTVVGSSVVSVMHVKYGGFTSFSDMFVSESIRGTIFDIALLSKASHILSTSSNMARAAFLLGEAKALAGSRRGGIHHTCDLYLANGSIVEPCGS